VGKKVIHVLSLTQKTELTSPFDKSGVLEKDSEGYSRTEKIGTCSFNISTALK